MQGGGAVVYPFGVERTHLPQRADASLPLMRLTYAKISVSEIKEVYYHVIVSGYGKLKLNTKRGINIRLGKEISKERGGGPKINHEIWAILMKRLGPQRPAIAPSVRFHRLPPYPRSRGRGYREAVA